MNYEDLIKNAISKNEVVQLLCGNGRYEIQNSEFVQDVFPTNIMSVLVNCCLLYTSPSPRDRTRSRMPSSA